MARPDRSRLEPSPWLIPLLQSPGWRRDDETDRAVQQGLQAIERRDWAAAADWIAYAQRRIRNDATLTFALAEIHLQRGNPAAAGMFGFLAERTDWPEAWWRLALCHARESRPDDARTALQRRMSTAAPPRQPDFARLADRIAGDRGWCGLDNTGRIAVSAPGPVRLALDGKPLRGRKLPPSWPHAAQLTADSNGQPLIGSPIDIASVTRVEGFVSTANGAIEGWCWFPGEPERAPAITLAGHPVATTAWLAKRDPERPFEIPWCFTTVADPAVERADVLGPHGNRLLGAPLYPWAETDGAAPRLPPVSLADPAQRRVLVVIPVYRGLQTTLDCLASVQAARSGIEDVLVIADGSPDRELVAQLRAWSEAGDFTFDEQAENRGFVATANRGLRAAAGRDVVLLNSDTIVPPGWLAELRAALRSAPGIGTVTPLSNNATIFSYPSLENGGPAADAAAHAVLAAKVNAGVTVDVPTAHGFCMYIRHECLQQTGLFREDIFAQGYGEENDFCLRARKLGWRHVAAAGCLVAHHESVSFGTARDHLRRRNQEIINRLHPGYDDEIVAWVAADPLLPARRAIDLARLRHDTAGQGAVLLVTHDCGGGVEKHVRDRAAAFRAQGLIPLVLRPSKNRQLALDESGRYPNLRFDPERELPDLLALLRTCAVQRAEIHHFIGYDLATIEAIAAAMPAYDMVLHDFSWYCPRGVLTRADHRYCGEPDLPACDICVASLGSQIGQDIMPSALHPRSASLFAGARQVRAPSTDTAKRYARRFAIKPQVQGWEDDTRPIRFRPPRPPGATRTVLVAGAISHHKGYGILLGLARLVQEKSLPLAFILAGFSIDDASLLATGAVRITGEYRDEDFTDLIRAQNADFAFMPALWPETWSYTLTGLWEAGLKVVAFDLGGPAERIKARGGGKVVPPHLPLERLAALMMDPGWIS